MRIPRIFIQQTLATDCEISLDEKASHHIHKVLRMQPGRELILFDGTGSEYPANIVAHDTKNTRVRTGTAISIHRESPLATHLAIGLSKGDRFDFVLQKATELGVSEITPLFTENTEVKLNKERIDKKMASWKQIIIGACEQCQRNILPVLNAPAKFAEYLENNTCELNLVLHHRSEKTLREYNPPKSVCLLIGPEGGLSANEIQLAEKTNFNALTLGPRVLRTETAPLVALSNIQLLWGDI